MKLMKRMKEELIELKNELKDKKTRWKFIRNNFLLIILAHIISFIPAFIFLMIGKNELAIMYFGFYTVPIPPMWLLWGTIFILMKIKL